jgi:hypothetical protein
MIQDSLREWIGAASVCSSRGKGVVYLDVVRQPAANDDQ